MILEEDSNVRLKRFLLDLSDHVHGVLRLSIEDSSGTLVLGDRPLPNDEKPYPF